MKSNSVLRKSFALLWIAASLVAVPLAADELMHNADFSRGSENWKGDFANDAGEGNPFQATSNQVTLNLRERHAVRIFQVFQPQTDEVTCTATFTPAPGVQYNGSAIVKDVASDVTEQEIAATSYNAASNTITEYTNPNYATYTTPFRTPVVIITDADDDKVALYREQNSSVRTVAPDSHPGNNPSSPNQPSFQPNAPSPAATSQPTSTVSTGAPINVIAHMKVKPHRAYRLYLAFPPGTGSVSVSKISVLDGNGQ